MLHRSTSSSTPPTLFSTLRLVVSRRHRRGQHASHSPFTTGTALVGCGLALSITAGALTIGATAGASATDSPAQAAASAGSATGTKHGATITPVKTPTPVDDDKPVIEALPVVTSGPVTGGTTVTLSGANLTDVATVTIGGQAAPVLSATDETVTVAAPAAPRYSEGTVPITVLDTTGTAVPLDVTPATTLADLKVKGAAAPALTFSYTPDEHITAQTNYVLTYWSSYNWQNYMSIDGADCANFASQGLIARGWTMDADWWYAADGQTSSSWISSTALYGYLGAHPERATYLGGDRTNVKVGDIAQFDWDDSGDLDHTTTVTRVDHTADGVKVYVAGHTKDSDYWDVDEALATGGGTVQFWGIKNQV
ncbi:MAG: amidase domain-containing protein [Leifsonia flava]